MKLLSIFKRESRVPATESDPDTALAAVDNARISAMIYLVQQDRESCDMNLDTVSAHALLQALARMITLQESDTGILLDTLAWVHAESASPLPLRVRCAALVWYVRAVLPVARAQCPHDPARESLASDLAHALAYPGTFDPEAAIDPESDPYTNPLISAIPC